MNSRLLGLFIAIIIPVGFFLVFDHFDTFNVLGRQNRPTLKRYFPLEANEKKDNSIVVKDTAYHTIPSFKFLAHTGDTVSNETFKDKILIADFFFTNCPGICPKMSSQLRRVQSEFREDDDLRFLSHTVDPERDDAETLATYARMFEADDEKWFFVTGEKPILYEQARKGYFITATEGDGGPEDFVHSEKLVLVDKNQIIRGYYDGTDSVDVNKMMVDIKVLGLEYNKGGRPELILDREKAAKNAENLKKQNSK